MTLVTSSITLLWRNDTSINKYINVKYESSDFSHKTTNDL